VDYIHLSTDTFRMAVPARRFDVEHSMDADARLARVEERTEHLQTDVTEIKSDLRRIDVKLDTLKDSVNSLAQRVATFEPKLEAMAASFEVKLGAMANSLDAKLGTMANAFDAKLGAMANAFDAKLGAMANSFDAKLEAMAASLDARLEAMAGSFDAKLGAMGGSFDAKLGAVGSSFDAKLNAMEAGIIKWMVGTAIALTAAAFGIAKFVN
jgi:DNA anti-recombination protein RmuC